MTDGLSLEGLIQLQSLMEKAGKAEVKHMRRALAVKRTPPNTESKKDIKEWLKPERQLEPKETKESFDETFIERASIMVAYTPATGGKSNQSVVVNAHISADTFSLIVHDIARPDIEKHGVDNSQFLQIQSPEVPLQRDGVMHLRQYPIEVDADDAKRNSLKLLWKMKEAIDLSKDLSFEQDLPDIMNTDAVRYSAFWWANKVLLTDKCVRNPALNMIFKNGVITRGSAVAIAEGLSAARPDATTRLARFVISECIAAVRKIDQTQQRLSKAIGHGKIMKLTLPEPRSVRDFIDVMCPATFIEFESDNERYIVQREGEGYKYRTHWHDNPKRTDSADLANEIDKGSDVRVRGHNALCLVKEDLLNLEWALVLNSQKHSRMKATLDLDIIILRPSGDPKTEYIKREATQEEGLSNAKKVAIAAVGLGGLGGGLAIDQAIGQQLGGYDNKPGWAGYSAMASIATAATNILPYWATATLGLGALTLGGYALLRRYMPSASSDMQQSASDPHNIQEHLEQKIQIWEKVRITTREPPEIDDPKLKREISDLAQKYGAAAQDLNRCIVYGVMFQVLGSDTFANMANDTSRAHVIADQGYTEKVASVMQELKNELEQKHAQSAASAAPAATEPAPAEKKHVAFGDSRVMIARL